MQQSNGTIGISVGSNAIVGIATTFTQDAKQGSFLYIYGLNQVFQVAKVNSDTSLTIGTPVKGQTGIAISNLVYTFCDHFTPVLGLPMPTANQQAVQITAMNRAWRILAREIPNPIP